MKITIEGKSARLHTAANPKVLAIIPSLEGRRIWAKDRLSFTFEPTAFNIGILENSLGAKIDASEEIANSFLAPSTKPALMGTVWHSKTAPMPHQEDANLFIGDKNVVALFMEQGTGKTKVAIDWGNYLFLNRRITAILVVSKKGAHSQWLEEEFPKHYAGQIGGQIWPFDRIAPHMFDRSGNELKVMAFNWDGVKTDRGRIKAMEFAETHAGKLLIIADESQEMKDKKSARHKILDKLKPFSSHRAILSGTPIAVDLCDEWAQLNWLDENILKIKYVTTFRSHFCILGGFQNKQVVAHRNVDQFRKMTAPYVFRVTSEEIGVLPPLHDAWRFDMTPTQKRMTLEIKRDLETKLDCGEEVGIDAKLAAFNKMAQISSGFFIREDKSIAEIMPIEKNPRVIKMLEWLDNVGDRHSIIWHRFRHDRELIVSALEKHNIPHVDYSTVKEKDWPAQREAFRQHSGQFVLLGNPQSGLGTGQNLQGACNNALYFSHADRFIDRQQSQFRILRIGTKGIVTFSDLIGRGSPDVRVLSNNARKKGVADMALDGLRELLAEMEAGLQS